ncbi:Dethiobiotin synthetase [uncultured Candidatus Thioglobus sp.]|nr:Dethiobiotin synthetase [uncultured Candidatus Thioglobus sp.]
MKGLFISGSGTDVGKTFIASRLIQLLNDKYSVVVRKPIESDCIKKTNRLIPKDAVLLNSLCTNPEPIDTVCVFQFAACVSGEKASFEQGITINLQNLIDAVQPSNQDDFVIIEGAGGIYSPIAQHLLNSELAAAIGLPIVLVVKDELGAINQALLSIEAAKKHNLTIAMVVLNQMQDNDLDNAVALSAYTEVDIVVFNKDKVNKFNDEASALI